MSNLLIKKPKLTAAVSTGVKEVQGGQNDTAVGTENGMGNENGNGNGMGVPNLDGGVSTIDGNVAVDTDSGGGVDAGMLSALDNEWLSGHNTRRQKYHVMYGGSYVPLKWSPALAASAKRYAEYMAKTGVWAHSDSDYGENLAWNGGSQPREISNIMTRWVENEEASWGGHFTQVLWRATKYVGCATASSSEYGSFQVCQYATPGNCGNRRKETMMETTTACLPECPPEGCF